MVVGMKDIGYTCTECEAWMCSDQACDVVVVVVGGVERGPGLA